MKKFLLMLTLSSFLFASSAFAIPWENNVLNFIQDDSAEELINVGDGDTDTILDDDDILKGVFSINAIDSPNDYNFTSNGLELTGIFELQVDTKTDLGEGLSNYTFKPSSDFESTYGTNAVAQFWLDDSPDFVWSGNDNTAADAYATASDGIPYWTFGLEGDAEWTISEAPEDVSDFSDTFQQLTQTDIGLNVISDPVLSQNGPQLLREVPFTTAAGEDVLVDLQATLSLLGKGSFTTEFDLRNQFNGAIKPVPEPTTLLLFGTGLLGLAAFGRKRFMNKS